MAIKLRVQENRVRLHVREDTVRLKASEGIPIYPSPYTGRIEVTPGEEAQTLETAGLMMTGDVKVNPIPSNYGRILYNGTTLKVY